MFRPLLNQKPEFLADQNVSGKSRHTIARWIDIDLFVDMIYERLVHMTYGGIIGTQASTRDDAWTPISLYSQIDQLKPGLGMDFIRKWISYRPHPMTHRLLSGINRASFAIPDAQPSFIHPSHASSRNSPTLLVSRNIFLRYSSKSKAGVIMDRIRNSLYFSTFYGYRQ